jgi:hypothetical protein
VDQANNIALLELFLALFLGLLFRVNVVSDDAAEGALFEAVAAMLGAFIFVYPVVRHPRWRAEHRGWARDYDCGQRAKACVRRASSLAASALLGAEDGFAMESHVL